MTRADLRGEPMVLLDLPITNQYYRGLVGDGEADANITATASTHEMVRSLVGAGIGCSILNMLPSTAITYAGDAVTAVPLKSGARPLTLALGHLSGKPRRLVEAFMDVIQSYFANAAAGELIVPDISGRRGDPGRVDDPV